MKNLNTVALEGRLTANAEVRAVPNTERICLSFTLAVNSPTREDGNTVDYANFIDCKYYVNKDRISSYLTKGVKICVSGEIRQDRWEDKNDGKRSRTFVLVGFLSFSEKRSEGGSSTSSSQSNVPDASVPSVEDFDDKDVPF